MPRRSLQLAALLGSSWLATVVAAGASTYPGPAPCDTTLQACITAAAPGEVVSIATDGPIVESVDIFEKSLTLEPAPGFAPLIKGALDVSGAPTPSAVTVRGLTVDGLIRAAVGTGDLELHLLDNTVSLVNILGGLGIFVFGGPPAAGELTAEIAGNVVTVIGDAGSNCDGIHVGPVGSTSTATVTGNQIDVVTGCSQGGGIVLQPGQGHELSADVIGNYVLANGASNGILARNPWQTAGSLLQTRIVNNVITGQLRRAGPSGGIGLSADGSMPLTAQVVNNTVVGNDTGIRVNANTLAGATITGVVANNLVAHNTTRNITIDPALEPAVSNDHNLVFDSVTDEFTPGPGTVTEDPLLVSTSDFHLQAGSPAIDAGNDARVPADVTTDIEGNPRILGTAVDIGAYERLPALVEVPALSELGAAGLATLLALCGWLLSWRA